MEMEPLTPGEAAPLDGCQVVARIDNQVVLASELLWQVNRVLEQNKDRIPPEQFAEIRESLMKQTLARGIDTKLLYGAFLHSGFPIENLPALEENLVPPFEEKEIPKLTKDLKVNSQRELELELSRLGSSLADVQRAFNERVIASEWVRTKVKIEEEVSPDDLLTYYKSHLSEYEYPTQARWEELMVRKSRFGTPRQAYAAMAELGNEAWQRLAATPNTTQPAFSELAKAKSDGFNADKGGQHDWTTQGALKAEQVDSALFTLPVGRMSKILESDQGFHIVRVLERKTAGRKPFTEVQNDIREKLKDERFRVAVEEYLANLRKDARIWTVYTGPVSAEVLLGQGPGKSQQR